MLYSSVFWQVIFACHTRFSPPHTTPPPWVCSESVSVQADAETESLLTVSEPLLCPPTNRDHLNIQCVAADRQRTRAFRVWGSGFSVQGSGFRVQGAGFRVQGVGFAMLGVEG